MENRIKFYRQKLRMKQCELSYLARRTQSEISMLERGRLNHECYPELVNEIARILQVPKEKLFR